MNITVQIDDISLSTMVGDVLAFDEEGGEYKAYGLHLTEAVWEKQRAEEERHRARRREKLLDGAR